MFEFADKNAFSDEKFKVKKSRGQDGDIIRRDGVSSVTVMWQDAYRRRIDVSHHCDTGQPISPGDVTILSCSSFNPELLVRESLLIRKLKH